MVKNILLIFNLKPPNLFSLSFSVFQISKTRFNIKSLIDKDFGSVYQINAKTKCLDHVEKFQELFNFKNSIDDLLAEEGKRDNRAILDDSKSQKLSNTQILKIKEDSSTAKQIIDQLVENSSTFESKTIYSQEKYLKKKQEKYSNYIRVYKPNTTLLCDIWFNQGAHRTGQLRIDSLAHILNLTNLRSGCKFMVVDNYFGLVSAAILERLIGDCSIFKSDLAKNVGKCVQILVGQGPTSNWRDAILALNYKEEYLNQCLFSVQINKTVPLLKDCAQTNILANEDKNKLDEADNKTNNQVNNELNNESNDELDEEFRKNKRLKTEERYLRKKKRIVEEQIALDLLSKKNFDGLILIARNFDMLEAANHLINFLSPSSQFVIFSDNLQLLTDCYNELKSKACNIKLNELWMRNYQVLPMRTRPEIEMFGKSGFILHGIKLEQKF